MAITTKNRATKSIPESFLPGGWIIGGKTRLLDAWEPSNIIYWAPSFQYKAHELTFTLDDGLCTPPSQRLGRVGKIKRLMHKSRSAKRTEESVILFDARYDSSANVAHILQNQIGVLLTGLASLGIKDYYRDVICIIHSDAPSYAIRLYEALGFRTITNSYDSFQGINLKMQPKMFPIRSVSSNALREHAYSLGILDKTQRKSGSIFVSRRGRRELRNLDEIESLLNTHGFATVYPEDLLIEDQIRTIAQGERIYGIHGAALGFQLFRNPEYHGVVMECFPSGFSTNWSRAMCFQSGDTWIGCQGELSQQVMKHILGGAHPHSSEGEKFAVSPSGVNTVLRIANRALEDGKDADPQALISEVEPIVVG